MSGFSPQWLALREPVDHRSVSSPVRKAVRASLADRAEARIVDLGCGSGSGLRALAPHLGPRQRWRLIDYDEALLQAARQALRAWADEAGMEGEALLLRKGDVDLHVMFEQRNLVADIEPTLATPADLVVSAAFFDLVSPEWMARFAGALAAQRLPLYTTLIYNGVEVWTPAHDAEARALAAFHAHQRSDKGFGVAAGPDASAALVAALRAQNYVVTRADSPWRMTGDDDAALIRALADGAADAVAEMRALAADEHAAWREARRQARAVTIGHEDLFARPL